MSTRNKEQRTKTKNENKEQQSTISHLLGHEDEELFKLNQAAPVVVELLHHLLHLKKKDLKRSSPPELKFVVNYSPNAFKGVNSNSA